MSPADLGSPPRFHLLKEPSAADAVEPWYLGIKGDHHSQNECLGYI
jgi:hypothetical protein